MKHILLFLFLLIDVSCIAQTTGAHKPITIDSTQFASSVIAMDGVLYNMNSSTQLPYAKFQSDVANCEGNISVYTSPKKIKGLFNVDMPADKKALITCYCTVLRTTKLHIAPATH